MKKAFLVILAAVAVLAFVGCIVPEKFEVSVDINKSGQYSVTYDGTVVMPLFLAGKPSEKDVKGFAAELLKDPDFKKVEYQGNARYKIFYEKSGSLNNPVYIFGRKGQGMSQLIALLPCRSNGKPCVMIEGSRPDKKELQELRKANIVPDGKLEVKTNGKVIKHNATKTPYFMGLFGSYQWLIRGVDGPVPYMRIVLE